MNPCPNCSALTEIPLCFRCQGTLRTLLIHAAVLAKELPINIVRLARAQTYRIGGKSAEIPLPFDDMAVEAAWVLADTLGAWADDLAACGVLYYRDATSQELALWLADHVLRLTGLSDAGCCLDEIRSAVDVCLDVVEPARRRTASDPADVERAREVWVTAIEAQRYLGAVYGITVRASRVRKWGERGQIIKIGDFYRVGDILYRLERMSHP